MTIMNKQSSNDDQTKAMLAGARVAVIGYGPEAREQALHLRVAGNHVTVSLRPGGMSWLRATKDGFSPAPTAAAVRDAEVVVVQVPEEDQPSVYWHAVAPNLEPGALVVFGRGQALHLGVLDAPGKVDVVLVTANGTLGRTGCRVAVHRDATGKALERAIAYARAAFGEAATTLGTTTVAEEVKADLAASEERVGGPAALLAEVDELLARGTHEPDQAKLLYYERLRDLLVAHRAIASRARTGARPSSGPPASTPSITGVVMRRRVRGAA
jgi:ketol-acid reductoisomerase